MDDLIIAMALSVVLAATKNPTKKKQLRAALAKVLNTTAVVYENDAEFWKLIKFRVPGQDPTQDQG